VNKKIIVTHIFPDIDAITSVWLFKKFDSQFEEAEVKFVPAGTTLDEKTADSDPEVIHVDTGLGRFDHHQTDERTCAAELVFNYLKQEKKISLKYQSAILRLIEVVKQIDHFENFFWEDSANDRYDLGLNKIFNNLKMSGQLNDKQLVEEGMKLIDAVVFGLRQKIKAEEAIKEGQEFETIWGKTLGLESQEGKADKLGLKMGYDLMIRKEPESNFVMIKCQPRDELDLTKAYETLKEKDTKAGWFFHSSKHIILNGSRHNPKVKPTRLSLDELIEIFKNIK